MSDSLLRTEILCPILWDEKPFVLSLPAMYVEDHIHLAFTIPWFGEIEGLFEVTDLLHMYNSIGYTQRVKLKPLE